MKNTKIVALVAAVALLVLGTAFASFAATYNWYEQDGEWRCADKNGDDYYATWAKSGDGWYWLNDEGWMARATLVDEDTKYVDETGRMVSNQWVKLSDDEGNEWWSYFQAGGKKLCGKDSGAKPVTVGSNKYVFNPDGKMLSGWVLEDYSDPKTDDYAWQEGLYYCGDEEDGAVKYGWQLIECYDEDQDFVDNNYWFYFQPNGKKFFAPDGYELKEKGINGKTYVFDNYGVMKAEWEPVYLTTASTSTVSSITSYAWFQSVDIGAKFANGWFKVVPQADVDPTNNEDEAAKWFYAKGGKLAHGEVKSINGKKYGFAVNGEMVSGLVAAEAVADPEEANKVLYEFTAIDDAAKMDTYVNPAYTSLSDAIYYFSADEDNDGSMKTGAQTVNVDGDDYSFYFGTKGSGKGLGITGRQSNKYYNNGKKIAADDTYADYMFFARRTSELGFDSVGVVGYTASQMAVDANRIYDKDDNFIGWAVADAEYALISKTGAVQSSGSKKDGNDYTIKFVKATSKEVNDAYWLITY